jgi:hypothetical protein
MIQDINYLGAGEIFLTWWCLLFSIQCGIPWCMLFVDDVVLMDENMTGVDQKLEL